MAHDEVHGEARARRTGPSRRGGHRDVAARLPEDRRRCGSRRRGRWRHRRRSRRGGRPLDGIRRGRGVLRAAHRPAAGGIRPPRRAHGREPLVRQPPRLPLLVRRPARRRELRGARLRRLRQHLARRHRRRGPRLRGLDRRDHGPPEPRPGRGVPARQHADLRHRRSRHERGALRRVHDGPVQRAAPQRRRDDVGVRPRLLDQLHAAPQGHAALRRRGSADHGLVLPADAARALHAREELRRLRQLVLRCAVADVLQPVVLPRLDVARIRHEQGRRRLRQVARRTRGARRSSTGSRRPASPGGSTSTSSSSSRSPACCMHPCSSSTGAPSASRR